MGHNSTNANELRAYLERWERIEDEIKERRMDQKQIMAEAKNAGFEVKTMRKIIRIRSMDPLKREAEDLMLETYLSALGMLAGTPLADAAVSREFHKVQPKTKRTKSKSEETTSHANNYEEQQQPATDPDGFPLNSESAPLYGETLNGQDTSSEAA